MDETIDLRPYVDALVRRWWVILGAVIVGVLIAAYLHFSQSTYRATALVAITDPTQRLQFDERVINTLDLDVLMEAYPEMAASDDVLAIVLEQAQEMTDGDINTLSQLRGYLDVEPAADFRLVRLVAKHNDPEMAAALVNEWAKAFVKITDRVYLGASGEIQFYEEQLAETSQELQAIEQALVQFQAGSRMGIVDNQLLSLNELQASYLADQRRLSLLLDDINALRSQIQAGQSSSITWADQLTALMLQLKVYDTPSATPMPPSDPIQVQANPLANLTTNDRAEQLQLLSDLAQSAETSLGEIEVKLLALEPRIFELQREKESLFHQYDELVRSREVARETYVTLSRRIDEVRVQAADSGSSLRVASLSSPPTELQRTNLPVTAAIAGLAGLLISAAAILLFTWWKSTGNLQAT